ncbi:MAG: FIST C-terminal domain-containing protein [Treponema sp.]|nr:FIST C-terminal domain-containing protein [Treponema sp.]
MIEMRTAHTTEIDDIDDALEELLGQLNTAGLKKNSVGILCTGYDFIETGVTAALCERLPFKVIGMTVMAGASGDAFGVYRLDLAVLTSDDVLFETAVTPPLTGDNYEAEIAAAYNEARGKLPGDPAFIISFFPFIGALSGADILKSFDKTAGGVPIWGSVSSDMDMSYVHCRTVWSGGADKSVLAMTLVHGPVTPEFVVTAIPERNMRDSSAIVTESEGCTIKKVNGMRFDKYLESVDLVMRVGKESTTIPLVINYGDGSKPVTVAIYAMSEDGSAVCGGEVPQGSVLIIGQIDGDGILETAGESVSQLLNTGKKNGLLMFPCVSRYIMLSPRQDEEMKLAVESFGGKLPYLMGYSGGEICPVLGKDGRYYNRYHNYTFSACIF